MGHPPVGYLLGLVPVLVTRTCASLLVVLALSCGEANAPGAESARLPRPEGFTPSTMQTALPEEDGYIRMETAERMSLIATLEEYESHLEERHWERVGGDAFDLSQGLGSVWKNEDERLYVYVARREDGGTEFGINSCPPAPATDCQLNPDLPLELPSPYDVETPNS